VRRYASEAGPAKSSSLPWILTGGAILGVGGYFTYARNPEKAHDLAHKAADKVEGKKEEVTGGKPKAVFTGGDQGFVSLKLDEVVNVSPNTKKFRFSFPEEDQVSGLHITCGSILHQSACYGTDYMTSCAFDEVQGTGDGEASIEAIHANQRRR
jgi:cytochrome-b5 reductase